MNQQSTANYHHGDLKRALLLTSLQYLKEGKTLNMRALATTLNVTPGAIYRHFANKEALLAGLAEEGFKKMYDAFMHSPSPSAKERLFEIGERYVAFALQYPEHFKIMFGEFNWQSQNYHSLEKVSQDTFKVLENACFALKPNPEDAQWLITSAWSQVHGYALLMMRLKNQCQEHIFANIRTVIEKTWEPHF